MGSEAVSREIAVDDPAPIDKPLRVSCLSDVRGAGIRRVELVAADRHFVFIECAESAPARRHGDRAHGGHLPALARSRHSDVSARRQIDDDALTLLRVQADRSLRSALDRQGHCADRLTGRTERGCARRARRAARGAGRRRERVCCARRFRSLARTDEEPCFRGRARGRRRVCRIGAGGAPRLAGGSCAADEVAGVGIHATVVLEVGARLAGRGRRRARGGRLCPLRVERHVRGDGIRLRSRARE